MDADITGPPSPKLSECMKKAYANEMGLIPVKTRGGIDIMSINLLLDNDTDPSCGAGNCRSGKPVLERGYLGQCRLYVCGHASRNRGRSFDGFPIPSLKGIIVVTSPQELVSVIVEKAVKMAEMMNIPVLGIVENMSYYECPDCHSRHSIFGESHIEEVAAKHNISAVAKLPVNPAIAAACDLGEIEALDAPWLSELSASIEKMCQ